MIEKVAFIVRYTYKSRTEGTKELLSVAKEFNANEVELSLLSKQNGVILDQGEVFYPDRIVQNIELKKVYCIEEITYVYSYELHKIDDRKQYFQSRGWIVISENGQANEENTEFMFNENEFKI